VREAAPADAVGIARVHARTWQSAYGHIFPVERLDALTAAEDRRAQHWRETIAGGRARTHNLVADDDAAVVGFASFGPARGDDGTAELYAIYVHPEAWGKGVGRALMTESLERMRQDGFAEAVLWVLEDNPRTRRFYELAGWSFDGVAHEETYLDTPVRTVRYRIALG
jgi:ribosomal protein S18 acetylase RimI-like enzyme